MWISVSPSRVGLSSTTVMRRTQSLAFFASQPQALLINPARLTAALRSPLAQQLTLDVAVPAQDEEPPRAMIALSNPKVQKLRSATHNSARKFKG